MKSNVRVRVVSGFLAYFYSPFTGTDRTMKSRVQDPDPFTDDSVGTALVLQVLVLLDVLFL